MKDYSGFYYNVQGIYEDLIYYISPMPEQKLYMIKKYNPVVDTNKILKSIETGFNGYDYEVYGTKLLTFPFENPNNQKELCVLCEYEDFSNRQEFDGVVIVPSTMPNHDEFVEYLKFMTCEFPIVIDDRKQVPLVFEDSASTQKVEVMSSTPKPMEVAKPIEQPNTFSEQLETPQMKAQEGARTIASQIVQNNEQQNNQE